MKKVIEINLFGACVVRSTGTSEFEITGSKHKALIVLLATAPLGRRTRSYLQEILWGTSCYDSGRQSLRRALSDIRHIMGSQFAEVITSNNSELSLILDRISYIGRPGLGEFLEGMDLKEEGFNHWLTSMRVHPEQIYSLYSPASQPAVLLPSVPTIAVLPFRAITGGPDDAVLGDWLAEEISRSLSRSNLLAVISHLSCRSFSNRSVDIAGVRDELATDYCVSGCLRASGDEIIFDADFVDTHSGRILWTRQFSESRAKFFDNSSEGIASIVRAIGSSIADDAITYAADRNPRKMEDHRLIIGSVSYMHRRTLRDFARSRELLHEALRRMPTAAEAHAWLGNWHILSVFNGWSSDPAKDTQLAVDCTARALDLDPENAFCLTIDGFAHNNLLHRLDIAGERYDQALDRNPNEALSWLLRGALHAFKDEAKSAVLAAERAKRLSPMDPFDYFYDSIGATAYLADSNYERALELAERSLAHNDRHLSTLRAKIVALHHLGRTQDAQSAATELMQRQPRFTVSAYLRDHPAADNVIGRKAALAFKESGIPQ